MKNRMVPIALLIANLIYIPLYYVKIFHEVGVFEGIDASGNYIYDRRDFYYSAYQNLTAGGYTGWLYFSYVILALAVITSVAYIIFPERRAAKVVCYIFSMCLMITFIVILLLASTVWRAY